MARHSHSFERAKKWAEMSRVPVVPERNISSVTENYLDQLGGPERKDGRSRCIGF